MDTTTQIELEQLYNKNQTIPRIKKEFRLPAVIDHMKENGIPIDFGLDLLAQMVLHKRASAGILIGILGPKHFGKEVAELQTCADLLIKAAQVNLIDWDDAVQQFIIKLDVSDDVYQDLERYQYPLPCVVPPNTVRTNRDTGYFTSSGSIILKDNFHEDDVCLDHINRVNQTAYKINADTARMIKNSWRNLDRKKPDENQKDFARRVKAFEKYDASSREVMEALFMMGNEFYLTHRYDKRGRCYAQGYHVTTQGNPWNKAVIEFAHEELATGAIATPNQERKAA